MTTKAERIRQLLTAGVCNSMIADIVQCREEYVRTVKQRLSPRRRAQDVAYKTAMRETSDYDLRILAGRIACREARKAGSSTTEANRRMVMAHSRAISATCDHRAARAAYHAAKRGTANAGA